MSDSKSILVDELKLNGAETCLFLSLVNQTVGTTKRLNCSSRRDICMSSVFPIAGTCVVS
jgi:hypothetical protein